MFADCAFKPGNSVIYRLTKISQCPGPRARNVIPAPNGDDYTYQVDKFWIVERVLGPGRLLVRTRRGKRRFLSSDDQNLRRPSWWELLLHRNQFPSSAEDLDDSVSENT